MGPKTVTPTKFLKRFLPDAHYFRGHRSLQFLTRLMDPNVWHLNRRSVAGGVWIGFFFAFQPLPIQMPAAAATAIWTRVNLPLAVVTTWVSNPLTFYPIYYFNFSVGCLITGIDGTWAAADFSLSAIFGEASRLALPLFMGSFIVGSVAATAGYWGIRLLWRLYVIQTWLAKKALAKSRQRHASAKRKQS